MDHCLEPAAVEPGDQFGWGYQVNDLVLGKITPLGVIAAEFVTDHNVRRAGLIKLGDHIRSDKTGPTRDQKHAYLARRPACPQTFAPVSRRVQCQALMRRKWLRTQ